MSERYEKPSNASKNPHQTTIQTLAAMEEGYDAMDGQLLSALSGANKQLYLIRYPAEVICPSLSCCEPC